MGDKAKRFLFAAARLSLIGFVTGFVSVVLLLGLAMLIIQVQALLGLRSGVTSTMLLDCLKVAMAVGFVAAACFVTFESIAFFRN
jgi:hypothetical protein